MGREFQINYERRELPSGMVEWIIPVWGGVGAQDRQTAQNLLDPYLDNTGSRSIKAAIESDRTLGGAAHTCRVAKAENYTGLWVEFRVEVIA